VAETVLFCWVESKPPGFSVERSMAVYCLGGMACGPYAGRMPALRGGMLFAFGFVGRLHEGVRGGWG
jgi:hypothetical protein